MDPFPRSPAAAHLLDITRTVRRAGLRATGIDRIERSYIDYLIDDPAPLFGLVRTKLGFLLLDKGGCAALLDHCDQPIWKTPDLIAQLTRSTDKARAVTESGLRRIALDRSVPLRLTNILRRHLPHGTVYLNVGQTNFNDRVLHALRGCDGLTIGLYLHDTIPLDWPDLQTHTSRLRFKSFFSHVDRHADLVICNSHDTKSHVLKHAKHLTDDKIHVVLPGLPEMRVGTAPKGPWTGKPYFMAIGTLEPRKNIGFLLDLWSDYTGADDPQLVLCGRRGWMNEKVFERLDRKPANVHEIADLADADMWALLQESNGLLFPSFAEGFGYPAMEAAHLKVPIICNPLPVFKEVLGHSAIYAAESNRYDWHNKIKKLVPKRWAVGGEQNGFVSLESLTWQGHFNRLFTIL